MLDNSLHMIDASDSSRPMRSESNGIIPQTSKAFITHRGRKFYLRSQFDVSGLIFQIKVLCAHVYTKNLIVYRTFGMTGVSEYGVFLCLNLSLKLDQKFILTLPTPKITLTCAIMWCSLQQAEGPCPRSCCWHIPENRRLITIVLWEHDRFTSRVVAKPYSSSWNSLEANISESQCCSCAHRLSYSGTPSPSKHYST